MEINQKRQAEAQLKVKELLEIKEIERNRKRTISCIKSICSGSYDVLENEDLFRNMSLFLLKTAEGTEILQSAEFLAGLNDAAVDKEKVVRSRAVTLLSLILEWAETHSEQTTKRKVITSLFSWMVSEDEVVDGYDVVIEQLKDRCVEVLKAFKWDDAQIYLSLFSVVARDKDTKTPAIRSVASRTLDSIGSVAILSSLYNGLFVAHEIQLKNIEKCINCLGRNAMLYGLGFLGQVEKPEQKEILIDFFARAGEVAVDAIRVSKLSNAPGHVLVSLIKILKKIGKDSYYEIIADFLKSKDIAVQHEVIKYIIMGDERNVVPRLVNAAALVREELKPDLIKQLSVYTHPAIEDYLYDNLAKIISKPVDVSQTLISVLVVGFKNYPDQKNINLLRSCLICLSESRKSHKLKCLVNDVIRGLESKLRYKNRLKADHDEVSYDFDPVTERDGLPELIDFVDDIKHIVSKGNTSKAVKMLTEKSIWYAGEKDFHKAEWLRDMILSVDQTALEEIFDVENEISKQHKTTVPESFRELWGALSDTLGEEHFEQFYLALKHEQFYSGEIVEAEGDRNETLYFIKSGSVSLSYDSGGTDIFVKRLKPGTVIGYDVFFKISIWTLTVKAEAATELFALEKSALKQLEEDAPGIQDALQRYCDDNNFSASVFDTQRQDRRGMYRRLAYKDVKVQLLDLYGESRGRAIRCKLQDISTDGFSYTIRIAKRDNAAMLLGRKAKLVSDSDSSVHSDIEGDIVAVESLSVEEPYYKVCVKMLSPLNDNEVSAMII